MNQKTEAIIAQAYALAKFRREIEELKQYTASLLSDCKRAQDSLDMERDQHGKTRSDSADFERQIQALRKHVTTLTDDYEALRKERDELKASYAQAFADLQAAHDVGDKMQDRIDALESKLREVQR